MSTRAGEFETLRDVINEVGRDAARFIFLTRHYESALDFDLEVAKQQTNDNPVYYVQYVHARIASIVRKANTQGIREILWDDEAAALLEAPEEIDLIKVLARYPDMLAGSARHMEPHRVTYYLMELASPVMTRCAGLESRASVCRSGTPRPRRGSCCQRTGLPTGATTVR